MKGTTGIYTYVHITVPYKLPQIISYFNSLHLEFRKKKLYSNRREEESKIHVCMCVRARVVFARVKVHYLTLRLPRCKGLGTVRTYVRLAQVNLLFGKSVQGSTYLDGWVLLKKSLKSGLD